MKCLRHISLVILALLAIGLPPALGQQLKAPTGGITVNGKFFKGGQYLPSGVIIGPYRYAKRQPFVSFGFTRLNLKPRALVARTNSTRVENE